jgi:multisubunit Na+/H+ antiporter MnhG subunit
VRVLRWARGGRAVTGSALDCCSMHLLPRFSLIATLTKHDIAGIIIAVVAVALIVTGGAKLATKAVKGVLVLMVLGVLAAVVAVLLLTRAI